MLLDKKTQLTEQDKEFARLDGQWKPLPPVTWTDRFLTLSAKDLAEKVEKAKQHAEFSEFRKLTGLKRKAFGKESPVAHLASFYHWLCTGEYTQTANTEAAQSGTTSDNGPEKKRKTENKKVLDEDSKKAKTADPKDEVSNKRKAIDDLGPQASKPKIEDQPLKKMESKDTGGRGATHSVHDTM